MNTPTLCPDDKGRCVQVGIEAIFTAVPESAPADYARGILHYAQGEFVAAIQAFRSAIEREPQNLNYHLILGQTYEKSEQVQQAIQAYQHVLALNPDHVVAKQKLAVLANREDDKP